jgi:Co-chaperonin GroES (HSP10)
MVTVKGDRVLVKPDEQAKQTASGLALVTQTAEAYQTGEVKAVGPGRDLGNGRTIPIGLKPGDKVLYLRHTANMVKAGEDMVIIPHAEVLAVLED